MSITDELRRWKVNIHPRLSPEDVLQLQCELNAIAHRIDVAHKHAIECIDNRDPETMTENGWVKLPVDADGVPICIGDMLKDDAEFKSEGVVECLMLDGTGWFVGFGNGWADETIHEWRHYHKPTVEDVLHNLICDIEEGVRDEREIIAEYAAKLLLEAN